MSEQPSTHGGNGQDSAGRFTVGNRLGRGNPLAGRAAKLRAVLLKTVTRKDMRLIAKALIKKAIDGDMVAIREVYDRTGGKPASTETIERIESIERALSERQED